MKKIGVALLAMSGVAFLGAMAMMMIDGYVYHALVIMMIVGALAGSFPGWYE